MNTEEIYRCPECNARLSGITTSQGPALRCQPCGKSWPYGEIVAKQGRPEDPGGELYKVSNG